MTQSPQDPEWPRPRRTVPGAHGEAPRCRRGAQTTPSSPPGCWFYFLFYFIFVILFFKHCQIKLFLFQIFKSHRCTFRPRARPAGGGRAPCAGRQPHGTRPRTVPGSGECPRALETLNIPRVRHSSCSQCLLAVHSPGIPPCLQALALSCSLHRMEPTPGSPLGPRSAALPPPAAQHRKGLVRSHSSSLSFPYFFLKMDIFHRQEVGAKETTSSQRALSRCRGLAPLPLSIPPGANSDGMDPKTRGYLVIYYKSPASN